MAFDGQELKWLEVRTKDPCTCWLVLMVLTRVVKSHNFTSWGIHVSRTLERKHQEPHESYSLSGACTGILNGHIAVIVGGKEELPSESFTSVSRLDLFDLNTTKWLTGYDVHGELTHRIGHSVVTLDKKAYTFGGEPLDPSVGFEVSLNGLIGDMFEISYEEDVLYCIDITPISGDGTDPTIPPLPAPSERAWHASAAVVYRETTSDPESPPTQGILVLGGKNSKGATLSDIWMLTVNTPGHKPRWQQLSPTGNSPLPLAYHNAVTIGGGDKVVVLGGTRKLSMNSSIHVLDLVANTWNAITIPGENPESSLIPRVLTARCCATALALQLPIDEETGLIRRIKDSEPGDKSCNPQEAIVIFGGFSKYEPALCSSSMIILEPQHARIREVHLPAAGIKSCMGHGIAIRPDNRGFFLFGGIPIPDPGQPQSFLDSTTALDFWKTPADFPSEAEEAQRQADENPDKTKTLSNGDVYVGEMNADQKQRHGKGKCSYANGDEYDGDWRDDQRCGQGVMRYASSQNMYAGLWENDQRHGYGIYEFHLPDSYSGAHQRQPKKYEGQWMHDRKHGTGTLTFSNGTKLVGSWVDDVLDTRERSCIEGYEDGQNGICRYEGEVCDGVPHGQGESHHVSGEVYKGSWITGSRSGHGVATLRDGSVYCGEWRNGRRNGFGVFDDVRTRAHYDGKWVGGVRCGHGVCKYANGCEYEGDWLNDVRHGTGRYTIPDSTCYAGAWLHDKFCGDGTFMLNIEDINATDHDNEAT
ncbi:Radial spoke head 10 B [Phytophthora nicotianae]|uniref:Radial spoke head 10 B n=1 Tax=Phytophthora nicotianae TaxID=4792 RepID=A0A0W8DZA2_PHYNI|nr:Radial spoke head 10 B [Phytophthora nicotianae]KUG01446.1 Radial spoke head 10 B [Phytophthora nicotianae]